MSDFKFEGEVNSLSEAQINYVSQVLKELGFEDEKVIIEPVGKADDNYVANVKRIIIEKGEEKFTIIAKVAPNNPMLRNALPTGILFRNEHIMYTQVFPKFVELENKADVPSNERLRFPACYGTYMEEPNEIILLEDLKESEFILLDKYQSLTDENMKLVLRNLSILHTLSYALKHEDPETYDSFKKQLVNTLSILAGVEAMKMFFKQIEDNVLALLDNNQYKKLVKGSITGLPQILNKNMKYDVASKYSVIQQGDAWINNLMFRMENGKSVECCMIDYQQASHNSPVADLHYMIFNCSDYETRCNHYYQWIDYYYSELDKRLSNFRLKANLILPRDQLDADLRRLGKVGFAASIMMANNLSLETHEAAKMKDAMENNPLEAMMDVVTNSFIESTSKTRFKDRVEGLIASFTEFGYI